MSTKHLGMSKCHVLQVSEEMRPVGAVEQIDHGSIRPHEHRETRRRQLSEEIP